MRQIPAIASSEGGNYGFNADNADNTYNENYADHAGSSGSLRSALITNSAIHVVRDGGCSVFRTCKSASGVWHTDCRNAAQCESLGHRPRNRAISNTKALKGRDGGMPHHFAPLGLFLSRSIFPRAMPWAFTFRAFGPCLSVRLQKKSLGRIRDQGHRIR